MGNDEKFINIAGRTHLSFHRILRSVFLDFIQFDSIVIQQPTTSHQPLPTTIDSDVSLSRKHKPCKRIALMIDLYPSFLFSKT